MGQLDKTLMQFTVMIDAANYEIIIAESEEAAKREFVRELGFEDYPQFKKWMQLRKLPGELQVRRVG